MAVAALITDLIFVSKVKGTADALGVPLTIVRNIANLEKEIQKGADSVIVDLNADGVDAIEAIRLIKSASPATHVVAYVSHVQKELADLAKAAGADLVLPRSKFSQDLPMLLQTLSQINPRPRP